MLSIQSTYVAFIMNFELHDFLFLFIQHKKKKNYLAIMSCTHDISEINKISSIPHGMLSNGNSKCLPCAIIIFIIFNIIYNHQNHNTKFMLARCSRCRQTFTFIKYVFMKEYQKCLMGENIRKKKKKKIRKRKILCVNQNFHILIFDVNISALLSQYQQTHQ